MKVLTQRIDAKTGKVLEQSFHSNGKSRLLYSTKFNAIERSHDTIEFVTRRGRKMIVYSIYLVTV